MPEPWITGNVDLRPVRVGLALDSGSPSSIVRAIQMATAVWGGRLYPLLPSDDPDRALSLAELLGVDVIFAVDDDQRSIELAETPGFHWRWPPENPFEVVPTGDHVLRLDAAIESIRQKANEAELPLWNAVWTETHPLALLNAAIFGVFEDEAPLGRLWSEIATEIQLESDGSLPEGIGLSPLRATMFEIHQPRASAGLVAIDPTNPKHIVQYWNHRALGHDVAPWPIGYSALAERTLHEWMMNQEWPIGFRGSPEFSIWSDGQTVPDDLSEFTRDRLSDETSVVSRDLGIFVVDRPIDGEVTATHRSRPFEARPPNDAWQFQVPLPEVSFLRSNFWWEKYGTVAAEVRITFESDLRAGRRPTAPGFRGFAAGMRSPASMTSKFARPSKGGFVVSAEVPQDVLDVPLISSLDLVDQLLRPQGWEVGISDSGRWVLRLIEVLGGAFPDSIANQPAARSVLEKASRTPFGRPVRSLIDEADKYKGDWPRISLQGSYAEAVVRRLTVRRALRARLKLRCLACGVQASLSADELGDDYTCQLCGETSPLGLLLSVDKPTWLLKTAGNLPIERLRETFPIMATISAFASLTGHGRSLPHHVVGVTVRRGNFSCELDVVFVLHDYERPAVIIGEAKSWSDELDKNDAENLSQVQDAIRSAGIDCHILYATLREDLTLGEKHILRDLVRMAPMPLRTSRGMANSPSLPIVLTGKSLSVETYDEHHPAKDAYASLHRMATHSCRSELGFVGFVHKIEGDWDSPLEPTFDEEE